ncbi:MAG: HAD family hydrolase [Desulfomonilia bacterium]|nr:HAD family hydrolase [Desulfomonilia bacterium]
MGRGLSLSFDLDGTLTELSFADAIWLEAIPSLVAKHQGISISSARQRCVSAYRSVGDASIRWYQLSYWLESFDLQDIDPETLISQYTHRISLFTDVLPVLGFLRSRGHNLYIFSNASRTFLDREVSYCGLSSYFQEIISLPDDWSMVKSQPDSYRKLRHAVGHEVIHVGDHLTFDCEIPRSIGMHAYHLWRGQGPRRDDSLSSLDEFAHRITGDRQV